MAAAHEMSGTSSTGTLRREGSYLYPACVGAFALISAAVAFIDPIAFAVFVAIPIIPFGIFAILKGMTGNKTYGVLLGVIIIVVLTANVRFRLYNEKDIDFQVAAKLCAIAAMTVLSSLFIRRIFDCIHVPGTLIWLCFFTYTTATSAYAIKPALAFVGAASLLAGFLFMCYLRVQIGRGGAIYVLVVAGTVLCVASLAVYVLVPSLGHMYDWIGGEFVETSRLQGLFGHSNGAGVSGALAVLLVIAFYARQPGQSRALAWVAAISGSLCLMLSNNRMAIFALAMSVCSLYMFKRVVARRALLLCAVALLGASFVTVFEILGYG
jgi:hypothetical protein